MLSSRRRQGGAEVARTIPDYRYLRMKHRPSFPRWGQALRVADLYSGVGALSLGVWEACRRLSFGFRPVAAIDIDPLALQVYLRNFPRARTFPGDMTTLIDGALGTSPTPQEKALMGKVGPVEFALAGSPCQGFSPLNIHTRGSDERNGLYLRSTRFVELSQPDFVLLENVPDVLNGKIDVVGETVESLHAMGYAVDHEVVNLSDIGIPQSRRRHVLVAARTRNVSIRNIVERSKVNRPRSVRWAIHELENEAETTLMTRRSRLSPANKARVRYLHRTGKYDLPNWMRPPCHRKGNHSYKSMYGRLDYRGLAQTITSGFGSPGQGRFLHPACERTITPHEAGRLQFFPDFFDFEPANHRSALCEMIGNAAPWKLSFVFAYDFLSRERKSGRMATRTAGKAGVYN
jgi:DNA (cytosine-5)-methyltransferase 1